MFPYPIKDNEDFVISVAGEQDINGVPIVSKSITFKGNFNSKVSVKYDKTGKQVTTMGMIFHKGDLDCNENEVFGTVNVNGFDRMIHSFIKVKDPVTNSIHHVEIEVI